MRVAVALCLLVAGAVQAQEARESGVEIEEVMVRAHPLAADGMAQASLVLEAKERSGGAYYFYCRIGELYGKGKLSLPTFGHADDGQEAVLSHIEIRLNLNGSRNVETAF